MPLPTPMPNAVPELGYYYHYKHDPRGLANIYAYEVCGIIFHTEDDARPGEEHFVNYRPLYEHAPVYQASLKLGIPCVDGRPLSMWMGTVEKEGETIPRFTRITNEGTIALLNAMRNKMYPKG